MATEWKMNRVWECTECGKTHELKVDAKKCHGYNYPLDITFPSCVKCGFVPETDMEYCPECKKQEIEKLNEWNKLVKGE